MRKGHMRRIAYIIAVAAAVILAAVVVIRLVSGTEDRWEAEDTYTEAVESFTSVPIDTAPSLPPAPFQDEAKEAQAAHSYEVPIQVDFEEIRKTAPDVVGWIFCEGTAINYPIVRGDDDSFYLTHNYKGDHSSAGSIMMGTTCAADFSDRNILLYGHNMAA